MELFHKSLAFEAKASADARTIEGYASTYGNIDSYGDIVLPGAFTESLKTRMPKMLSQHDARQVIGKWEKVSEDSKGLIVKGSFANTAAGNDMYELAKIGAIDSMSIGYTPNEGGWEFTEAGIRNLKDVTLYEVSLVTFPANEKAVITGVKNKPTPRELEQHLRDVGFSHSEAKALLAGGYRAIQPQRDVELQALMTSINHANNILRG